MAPSIRLLFLIFFAPVLSFAQEKLSPDEIHERRYQKRIKQEYLEGVYIPKDLGDVFVRLNKLIDPKSKGKFKRLPEEEAGTRLHFSLGRWIIYNWGFYEGSRLSHYLKGLGLSYPDDMARFIIITYHRYLNDEQLNVKALSQQLVERRKEEWREEMREGEILHKETRKRPVEDQNR